MYPFVVEQYRSDGTLHSQTPMWGFTKDDAEKRYREIRSIPINTKLQVEVVLTPMFDYTKKSAGDFG